MSKSLIDKEVFMVGALDSKRNYTIKNYTRMNQFFSEYVIAEKRKDDNWGLPTNPNFVEEYYKLNMDNPNLHITLQLKHSESPIFLLSCGGMNIIHYLKLKVNMITKDIISSLKESIHLLKHIDKTKNEI